MSQERNRELISAYNILLMIVKSLKEYKRRIDHKEEDPEEELRTLIYLIKFSKDGSIGSIVSEDADSILSEENKNRKYIKLEILIRKIKSCINDMQEGMEVYNVIENNLKS